jgi:hypothetical protein
MAVTPPTYDTTPVRLPVREYGEKPGHIAVDVKRKKEAEHFEPETKPDQKRARGMEAGKRISDVSEPHVNYLKKLTEELACAMEDSCFEKTPTEFLPQSEINKILPCQSTDGSGRHRSIDYILRIMCILPEEASEEEIALARYILESARITFLIAVHLPLQLEQLRAAMSIFKEEGFTDDCLPIEDWPRDRLKSGSDNHRFVRMERKQNMQEMDIWSVWSIGEFQTKQKKFLAPIVSTAVPQSDFAHGTLPFIRKAESVNRNGGAHGVVNGYQIHPAHYYDPESKVNEPY